MRELTRLAVIPPSVNTINLAGEALTWDLVEALYQFPYIDAVYNLWGPSEDTTYSSWFLCPREKTTPCNVPIGYAVDGGEVFILDKDLKELVQGEEGEICLAGQGLALGYYLNDELTQQKFIKRADGKQIYKTGDLGFIDAAGIVHFKGRIDLQVKVNGFRIELEEIENNLNSLPEVLEAVVTVISHQNHQQLLAGVRVQSTAEKAQLIALLREKLSIHLPEYMLPQRWYVTEEFLPRTPNGKLCRKKVVLLAADTANEIQFAEDSFAELVFNSLGHPFDENQSYLANGGNSLAALHLLSALEEQWEHPLSLVDILNRETAIKEWRQHLQIPNRNKPPQSIMSPAHQLFASEKRMWHVLNAQKNSNAYNVSMWFTLNGTFDQERFVTACQKVFAAHSTLCSNYHLEQNQLIRKPGVEPISLVQKDYSSLEARVFPILLAKVKQSIFDKPFDLEHESLFRVMLIKENEQQSHFLLCAPHILLDGLALNSLLQEISLVYSNPEQTMKASSLVELLTLEHSQHQAALEKAVFFWQQHYEKELPKINWPQQKKSEESIFAHVELDATIGKKLARLAQKYEISSASFYFYLFNFILYRFGLGNDFSVGYPIANRSHASAKNLMVNLSNTLPLRTLIHEEETLGRFIQSSYPKYLAALSHQSASIDQVLEQLQTNNKLPEGLFDILFSYMDFATQQLELSGCVVHGDFYQQPQAKAPLVLSLIFLADEKISIRIEAKQSHLEQTFIQSLGECYAHLLTHIEQQWDKKLTKVDIVPPAQRDLIKQNLCYEKCAGQAATIADWFMQSVQKYPGHLAIIDGDNKITYEELYCQTLHIVGGLKAQKVRPGSGIGISMSRSWKLVVAIMGTLLAGCHYVPLDRRNPKDRLDYISQDANLAAVISDETFLSPAPVYLYDALSQSQPTSPERNRNAEQTVYIIYTSGTTGQPKGVPISHDNVVRLFTSCQRWGNFSEHDVWTLFHSYAFDFSVWELFGALLFGGKLVIVPEKTVSDSLAVIKLINEHHVTVFSQTPTAFKNVLLQAKELKHPPRMIVFGGEALSPSMLDAWWKIWGDSTALINMYGITEITVHATYQLMDSKIHTSLIGKPLSHVGLVVLDAHGEIAPVGVAGELYICGKGVSKGYINKQELTNQKFNTHVFFEQSDFFYRSGDGVRLNAEGRYEYLGRLDKQINLNGFRIEQEEIIKVLKSIKGIKQAEITLINREGLDLMVAYYTSEQTLDGAEISRQLATLLPAYAVPSLYVELSHFPMTINGKIDVKALPEPDLAHNTLADEQMTSMDMPIDKVKFCWKKSLGIAHVDDKKAFFDHGGNSMKAIILVNHLKKQFNNEIISLIDIFRYPTINEQAEVIISRMQRSNAHE